MNATTPTTPAVYIVKSGVATAGEYGSLSQKDKDDMKAYAKQEMQLLGIPVKE